MNYKFLQIGMYGGREYAYVLDQDRNCVLRLPVYDGQVQHTHVPPAPMPTRDETYHPPMPQMPEHTSPQVNYDLPDKPASIMPPGLAAMMRDGNEMGPNGY